MQIPFLLPKPNHEKLIGTLSSVSDPNKLQAVVVKGSITGGSKRKSNDDAYNRLCYVDGCLLHLFRSQMVGYT